MITDEPTESNGARRSLLLRAFLAQRRARVEPRTAAAAQTVHSDTMRRHVAMNRRRVARAHEIDEHRRDNRLRCTAIRLPGFDTREKTPNELTRRKRHGKPGTSRAPSRSPPQRAAAKPAARATVQNARLMPNSRRAYDSDQKPIRSRTTSIVSRARRRHRSAPAANASSTDLGLAASSAARRRIGTSSASIDSASTFLQSIHPQPAVRHCTATCSTVPGGLNARWRW
jgi:hypothetical protein